jgi:hypothetical protein
MVDKTGEGKFLFEFCLDSEGCDGLEFLQTAY